MQTSMLQYVGFRARVGVIVASVTSFTVQLGVVAISYPFEYHSILYPVCEMQSFKSEGKHISPGEISRSSNKYFWYLLDLLYFSKWSEGKLKASFETLAHESKNAGNSFSGVLQAAVTSLTT
jgi:hypothetical protein